VRDRLTFANVMSVAAVFIALGGTAFAFKLGRNSVRSGQIAPGAVKSSDIGDRQVRARDAARSLGFTCPGAGQTGYFAGVCVERGFRAAQSWFDAATACRSDGGWLPDVGVLLDLGQEPGVTVGRPGAGLDSFEWSSGLAAFGADAKANVVDDGGNVAFDPVSDLHPFRCVRPPLR
jgi:hypothetical protein